MEKLEELETANNHLIKRLDKLKNAKSALLKEIWPSQWWRNMLFLAFALKHCFIKSAFILDSVLFLVFIEECWNVLLSSLSKRKEVSVESKPLLLNSW